MSSHRCSPRGLIAVLLMVFAFASPAALFAQSGVIQGRLLDTGGAGINGVFVRLTRPWGDGVATTTTDTIALQSGRYEFAGLPDGEYVVQVPWDAGRDLAGQLYPGVPEHDWDLAARIQITGGNTVVLNDLTLRPAASISGSISGLFTGQNVSVTAQDPITGRHRGGTWSDPTLLTYRLDGLPSGTFRVRVDPWGLPLAVQWYDGKTRQAEADPVAVAEDDDVSGIDFTLSDGYGISGTLTLADNPVDPAPFFGQMNVSVQDGLTYDWVQSSGVDPDGHYSVTNLPPGEYILWVNTSQSGYVSEVYRQGAENEWDSNRATRLTIDTTGISGVDLTLERGWTIAGSVTLDTDGDGTGDRAPSCASVWVNGLSGQPGSGTGTDASGAFTVVGLRTGSYQLQVQSCAVADPFVGERWEDRTEFESGDAIDVSADVVLPRPLTVATGPAISGRVFFDVNLNGVWDPGTDQPLPGFGIRLQQFGGGCCAHTSALADGLYSIQVPPGDYRVEAQTWNTTLLAEFWQDVWFWEQATAVPAPASGIDLSLIDGAAYGTLRGRVVGADTGAGVGGVQVQVTRFEGNWWVTSAWTAADGTFMVTNVPPGDYRVYFETWNANVVGDTDYIPTYWSVTGESGVTNSELMRVTYPATPDPVTGPGVDLGDFTLVIGGSISGFVSIEGGGPLPAGLSAGAQRTDGWWAPWASVEPSTGAFRVRGLPEGSYRVQLGTGSSGLVPVYYVSSTESTFSYDRATLVDVVVGVETSDANLITSEGGSIAGVVTRSDPAGPVAGAWVHVNLVNDPAGLGYGAQAQTDVAGAFEVPRLPTGEYQISVDPPTGDLARQDYPSTVLVTAPLATTGVEIALDPGTSISGTITLVPPAAAAFSQMWIQALDPATGQWRGSAQPAADGTYTIANLPAGDYVVEAQTQQSGYVYEIYRAGVADEWDRTRATVLTVTAAGPATGIDLTLEEGRRISGTVLLDVDDDGTGDRAPVCGSVYSGSFEGYPGSGTSTDATGHYTLVGMRPGTYDLTVESCSFDDPFVSEHWQNKSVFDNGDPIDLTVGNADIDLVVATGMEISGLVFRDLDADGTKDAGEPPLTNARVRFYPQTGGCCAHAWTTSDGRYLMHLAPGQYVVEASAGGTLLTEYWQNVFFQEQATLVDVRTADAPDIDFSLVDGTSFGTLRGRVVVSGTTTGIGGVTVRVRPTTSGWDIANTQTAADGTFVIAPLAPSTYVVYFDTYNTNRANDTDFVSSYWSESGAPGVIDPADLLVVFPTVPEPPGGPGTVLDDFGLVEGGSVSGTVTSPAGYPLPSSLGVWAESYESGGSGLPGADVDLATGAYTIRGLPAPATYRIPAAARGTNLGRVYYLSETLSTFDRNSASPVSVEVGQDTSPVNLHLFEGGSISGRVTRADNGEPVAGIGINVDLRNDPLNRGYWANATTGADGTYTVTGLPGGSYGVRAYAQGSGLANAVYPTSVPVTQPFETSNIDFALGAAGNIGGHVSYLVGGVPQPVVNVHLRAYDFATDEHLGDAYTDAAGDYVFDALPTGRRYRIEVEPREWSGPPFFDFSNFIREYYDDHVLWRDADPVPADPVGLTAAGVTGVDFQLALGGTITGRVTDAGGVPLVNLHVYATDFINGDWIGGNNTDQNGYYELRGMPAGQYRVRTSSFPRNYVDEYYHNTTQHHLAMPVTVPSSTEAEPVPIVDNIDFALAEGRSISGRVTEADGSTPVAGIQVNANGIDVSWGSGDTTDESGNFVMQGMPPGRYDVTVDTGGWPYERASQQVDVTAADATGVDFFLGPGATISGLVWRDGNGNDAFDAGEEVADAWVQVYDWNTGWWIANASSDASGQYQVTGLSAGMYQVRIEPDDRNYVRMYWPNAFSQSSALPVVVVEVGDVPQDVPDVDFKLVQGSEIRGRVYFDANNNGVEDPGEPPINTNVSAEPVAGGEWAWGNSDASGNYVIHGVRLDVYRVFARAQDLPYASEYWAPPLGTFRRSQASPVDVTGGAVSGVDFSLVLGGGVSGVVRDRDSLAPLANIQVNVNPFDGDGFGFGQRTDVTGGYLITGLPPGQYRVQASDPDGVYVAEYYEDAFFSNDADQVSVAARSALSDPLASVVDFDLASAGAIEGRVYYDANSSGGYDPGEELAGAIVDVNEFASTNRYIRGATSGTDGLFRVGGLPPGVGFKVAARGASGTDYLRVFYDGPVNGDAGSTASANAVELTVSAGGATTGINFALAPGGAIAGTVVDGNGDPIASLGLYASAQIAGGVSGGSSTNASGAYVIHGLSAGTFVLSAGGGSTPYGTEYWDNQTDFNAAYPISVAAGATTTGKDFVLPIMPRILSAPPTVSAVRGGTVSVAISADRLAGGLCGAAPCARVDFGPGVSVVTASLASGLFTYELAIAADAPLGARQIWVVNDFLVEDAATAAQTAFSITAQAGSEPPASGQWLYVADNALGEVRVYSTVDYAYVGSQPIGGGPNSLAVAGPLLYAGAANGRSLTVVDARLPAEVAKVEARGISGLLGVALTPQYIYTVNRDVGTNTLVNVLRRDTLEPLAPITVGLNPYAVVSDPTGQWVYVANASSSEVSVIEVATNTVVATIAIPGTSPRGIAFAPGNRAYVVASLGTYVVDTTTHTLVDLDGDAGNGVTPIPTRGGGSGLIAIAPGGTLAYIGAESSRIRVVDLATNRIVRTFSAGLSPNGLAVTDDGNTLFIGFGMSKTVSAVDTSNILSGAALPTMSIASLTNVAGLAIGPYVPTGAPPTAPQVALATGSPAENGGLPFSVAFTGTNFGTRPIVRLAGTWVQGTVTSSGPSSLTVEFPPDTPAGTHTVVVTDPDTGESGLSGTPLVVQPPAAFARTQDLYLASYCTDTVTVLETTGAIASIATQPFQGGLGLTPDGKLAFVNHLYVSPRYTSSALADEYYDVTILDLDPFSPTYRQRVATVPYVFGAFEAVTVTPNADNPNGIFAFVSNYNFLDAVSVIDPTTRAEVDLDDNPTTQTLPDFHPWFGNMGTKLPGITRLELDEEPVDGNNQLWAPALTPDGTLLYVTNVGYGGDPEIPARPAGLFVIDAVNHTPLAHLTGDGTPGAAMAAAYSLTLTPFKPDPDSLDGVFVYVAGVHPSLGNALYVFRAGEVTDAAAFVAVVPVPVPATDRARAIAIAPDGGTVYLSSRYEGTVIPVDVSVTPPVVLSPIPVALGVHALAVAPSDGLLYATNVFKGTVSVIDIRPGSPTYHQVLTTLAGGQCPTFAAVAPGLDEPRIGAIAPKEGPDAGGTEVTIIGANFPADARVWFGATEVSAANVHVDSSFTIRVVSPPGTGTIDVKVATADGSKFDVLSPGFTYKPDETAPIFNVSPHILSTAVVGPPPGDSPTVTVQVRWRTDEPSTSRVEYGIGGPSGSEVFDPTLVTEHVVTLTGLEPGATYQFRTTSVDAAGNFATLSAPPATQMPNVPDTTPPVILGTPSVSVTTTTATIQWTTDEAATTLVHYDATVDGNPTLQKAGPSGTRTAHSVTLGGLVPNKQHEFRVLSTDAVGNGPTSSAVATFRTAALPDSTPPVITTGPSVSYLSNNLVIVTWTTDELSTGFVNYGVSSIHEQTVIDTDLETVHIVFLTNLLPGTAYGFQAGSTDASGNTVLTADPFPAASLMALGARTLAAPMKAGAVTLEAGTTLSLTAATSGFTTPEPPDTAPPTVTGLTFTALGYDSVLLTVSTDEAASLLAQYGVADFGLSRFDPSFSLDHGLLLVGLTSGTTYQARVVLTDPKGNATTVADLTFATPAAPDTTAPVITGSSVSAITASSATVSWLTDEPATSEVRYGRSGQPLDSVVSTLGLRSAHALSLTGLAAGTSYDVQVASRDASGNMATATTSFTTAHLPPVVSSVTPSQGVSDTTLAVTLNGVRFAANAEVSVSAGMTLMGRTVNAAGTQIVATIQIAPNAPTGQGTITVLNPASGLSATAAFRIVDTTVPVVLITRPDNGSEVDRRTVDVTGTVSEMAVVTVNGVIAEVTPGTPLTWEATIQLAGTGLQVISATAEDQSGNRGTASITVNLTDAGPPTLTLTATPDELWPANHQMVPVTISVVVEDDSDPAPVVRLIAATSSEPDDENGNGDGNTVDDIQEADLGTDDRQVLLRAERAGGGGGRVYTLTYEAVDQAGNRTVATVEVRVPHSQ